jgi:hypothetical protein
VPEPRSNETILRQIQEAWTTAQAQLTVLREQVQHATQMAQAKVSSNVLVRDLDRAYRDLGEAVWAEVSKGKLQLPSQVAPVKKALEAVTTKIQAQNASINDLLAEGEEIAQRLQEKIARASKAVANPPKKR